MRVILEAPADSPASVNEIIDAVGRWPIRVCWMLARLEGMGWVTSKMTVRGRVTSPYTTRSGTRDGSRREAGIHG